MNRLEIFSPKISFIALVWLLVIFNAIGTSLGFVYTKRLHDQSTELTRNLEPLNEAIKNVKYNLATAHIIIEEVLVGDNFEDVDEAWGLINECLMIIDSFYFGGEGPFGEYLPVESEAIIESAGEISTKINELIQAGVDRFTNRTIVSIGSISDNEFDTAYESLQKNINAMLRKAPQDKKVAIALMKYEIADSHLYMEEYIAGEEDIDPESIMDQLENSLKIFYLSLGNEFPSIAAEFEIFTNLARQRMNQSKEGVIAGSEADQYFDAIYDSVIAAAENCEALIHSEISNKIADIKSSTKILTLLLTGTAFMGLVLFSYGSATLYLFLKNKNRKAQTT